MEENALDRKQNIVPLMVQDHCKITGLLDELEQKIEKNDRTYIKSFHTFEWELEKHIFIEEKAIFTSYTPEDINEGYKMLPELTKQHNFIINKLNNWRKDVRSKKRLDGFYEFKKFLINHKEFEEKEVYPRLDESLNETQKRQIVNRISEIV